MRGRCAGGQKVHVAPGRLLLFTAELDRIEGRKVFMTCRVTDAPGGTLYATSQAVFVAPKLRRLVVDGARYLAGALTGGRVSS